MNDFQLASSSPASDIIDPDIFLLGMAVHISIETTMPRYRECCRYEVDSFGGIMSSTYNPRKPL